MVPFTRRLLNGISIITESCAAGYKEINSNTISFGIAPRINACGRMGHADEALKLFLSKNLNEVQELTILLNNYKMVLNIKTYFLHLV